MTNQYNDMELDWQPTLNADGTERIAPDGTKIVQTKPMILTPKMFGKYGGWAFENVNGFWTWNGAANLIEKDVPVEVVLQLGKQNQNGKRYQNIMYVNPVPSDSPAVKKALELGAKKVDEENPTPKSQMHGDIDTNTSIREQAFFNNLSVEMLQQLDTAERAAAVSGWLDTMFLMMRPVVRERALRVKREIEAIEAEAAKEAAEAAAGEVEKEEEVVQTVEQAVEEPAAQPAAQQEKDENEEITDLPW
tara:strand:- start:344 stop:1087 length:744 start_codon:yes stop_codon:yes gene_type:complete